MSNNCIEHLPKRLGDLRLVQLDLSSNKLDNSNVNDWDWLDRPSIKSTLQNLNLADNSVSQQNSVWTIQNAVIFLYVCVSVGIFSVSFGKTSTTHGVSVKRQSLENDTICHSPFEETDSIEFGRQSNEFITKYHFTHGTSNVGFVGVRNVYGTSSHSATTACTTFSRSCSATISSLANFCQFRCEKEVRTTTPMRPIKQFKQFFKKISFFFFFVG